MGRRGAPGSARTRVTSSLQPSPLGLDRLGLTEAMGGLALGLIALFSSYDQRADRRENEADQERNRAAGDEAGRRPWQENVKLRQLNAKTQSLLSCVDQLCFPPESSFLALTRDQRPAKAPRRSNQALSNALRRSTAPAPLLPFSLSSCTARHS